MTEEEFNEYSWIEAMEIREQMLNAAVGYLTLANVPSRYLYGILENSDNGLLTFACSIVLHHRGEEWRKSEDQPSR